jgi:hypothetical protein
VIKELVLEDNDFITVYCQPNIEEITGRVFEYFDCFELSLPQAYSYCLSRAGDWRVDYQSKNLQMVSYQLPRTTGYDMIELIASDWGHELWFDTKNKVLTVYDKMGKEFGTLYSNELKIRQLSKQSSSYDYITVLRPIGKNGLTIAAIN